jgi:hypothetical protein
MGRVGEPQERIADLSPEIRSSAVEIHHSITFASTFTFTTTDLDHTSVALQPYSDICIKSRICI